MLRRIGRTLAGTLAAALAIAPLAAVAKGPLVVDAASHVVVMEYEAWFGPDAVTFQGSAAKPVLQSRDMVPYGGGYDSADPAVIRQHVAWFERLGVDAAIIDLTNNVSCIFDTGAKALDPKERNPCGQTTAAANRAFQRSNQAIRANDANLYPAWTRLGTGLKLIPLLSCQDRGCLVPYSPGAGFGADPCGSPGPTVAASTSIEKEAEYFAGLVGSHPDLAVLYEGKPLMLIFVPPPLDTDACRLVHLQALLRRTRLDARFTFRMVGGYFDSQPPFWANPQQTPAGPIRLKPYDGIWWSWVDRLKPAYHYYPSYNQAGARAENVTASIATAGQDGWGCPEPAYCPDAALRYGPHGTAYATLDAFMDEAVRLDPIFLILHQFNEFTPGDEGWNARTDDDIEPADLWGYGALAAVRGEIARYRRLTAATKTRN